MAIDQEIQRKVDAYRGNPQQLMQRYQQNQQLVDLLALQKLKSEKEAAARDMQLQMQQQPQTIKQQREAELLNMTKQEMMQQTQGVLMQRQAQQQQNMQQVAQQGLGALANQRPAPAPQGQPMPRMAAGGIVSFQPGGSVGGMRGLSEDLSLQEQIDIVLRRSDLNEGQKQSLISQLRQQQPRAEEQRKFVTPVGRASSARMPGVMGNIPAGSETNALDVMSATNPQIAPRRAQNAPMGADLAGLGAGPLTRPNNAPAGGIASLGPPTRPNNAPTEAVTPASPEAVPTENVPATSGGGSLPGISGGSAENAMQRGFQIADEYTGRAEKAGRYADMEAEMRALDAELYDPREERRDQLKAFLAGTANTTNFGSTMAGGTLASLNMRERQKAGRRERLKDIFEMAERGMTLDATLANGGLELGRTMYSEAMQNQRTALTAATSMRTAELQAEVRRAELEYNRLKDDRSFGLQERELEIEQARNEATAALTAAENDTRRFGAVSLALDRIQDQEAKVREYVVENSQLPALQDSLLMAVDEDEAARIGAAIAAEEARVNIQAESIFDQMGGVEARDLLAAELLSFTGTGATMLSMEDVAGIEPLDGEE